MKEGASLKIKDIPKLLKETYKGWMENDPFDLSAIVAYYAIFSLPALLIIIVAIAGTIFGKEAVEGKVAEQAGAMIGADAGKDIQEMIKNSYKKNTSVLMTIMGVATLLFGATGVFIALQKSLNKIWNVKPDPKKGGIKKMIFDRATSFGLVLSVGFLLLISLVITSLLAALSDWLSTRIPESLLVVFHIADFIISFGVITLLFALLYKFLPDVKVEWKSVWIGAVVTAFLFTIGKYALSLYLGTAEPGSTYGAAGSVILMLLWVSYSCLIMFFGAEFTQVYANYYGHRIVPTSYAIPAEAEVQRSKDW